jgi:hypothetical protein
MLFKHPLKAVSKVINLRHICNTIIVNGVIIHSCFIQRYLKVIQQKKLPCINPRQPFVFDEKQQRLLSYILKVLSPIDSLITKHLFNAQQLIVLSDPVTTRS